MSAAPVAGPAPYREAAHRYLAAGWRGVLPVGSRPAEKHAPPTGYTGREGAWPTTEAVDAWTSGSGTLNVALRLPRGVVGIDVDDYDDKPGADTMQAGVDAHGSPPRTWKSTSRTGASGIRLYRVPEDLELPGMLKHPTKPEQSGVEIIQRHHRYAVVAPSVHPEGRTYRWIAPDGTEGGFPTPGELPELPEPWRDHLAGTCACYPRTVFTIRGSGDAVADRLAAARAALASRASRHEGVLEPVLALVGFRNRGSRVAAEALEALHADFLAAVTAPGHGTVRSAREAEGEWHRMTEEGKAKTAGAGMPPWEDEPLESRFAFEAESVIEPEAIEDPWPAPIAPAAYHGILGEIVDAVAESTEADPVGILGSLLPMFGVACGGSRVLYQGSLQRAALATLLVGETGFGGRKGTALGIGQAVFGEAYPELEDLWLVGVASGEAIAGHLAREAEKAAKEKRPAEDRVLLVEPEFGRVLVIMGREGSTLSAVIRNAWDGVPIGHARSRDESLVTRHHVGMLGHITPVELRQRLSDSDASNGFANRILFLAVRRQRLIPFPTSPDDVVRPFARDLRATIEAAHVPAELAFDARARDRWEDFYTELALTPRLGLAGAVTGRHEAQVARLGLVYALADRSAVVGIDHLEAAIAVGEYARRSAVWALGGSTGNRHADALLRMLADGPLAWKDGKVALGLRTAADMSEVVAVLVGADLAEVVTVRREGGGRPQRVIRPKDAKGAKDAGGARTRESDSAT